MADDDRYGFTKGQAKAMAPTGIAAQNLANGTTIHRTLQMSAA